jgi:hypothetical protein
MRSSRPAALAHPRCSWLLSGALRHGGFAQFGTRFGTRFAPGPPRGRPRLQNPRPNLRCKTWLKRPRRSGSLACCASGSRRARRREAHHLRDDPRPRRERRSSPTRHERPAGRSAASSSAPASSSSTSQHAASTPIGLPPRSASTRSEPLRPSRGHPYEQRHRNHCPTHGEGARPPAAELEKGRGLGLWPSGDPSAVI